MEKIILNRVVTHRNKNVVIPMLTGIFLALYSLTGSLSYQRGVVLVMPELEQAIPFWTWTIWIYIVLYPAFLIWSLYTYKDTANMNKTTYGFLLLTFISCTFFMLFPTIYPREFFPLPHNDDLTTLIFRAMRAADKPSNCLPSLHVGLCYTFSYGFYQESKSKFWIAIFISTLIAISTLTTKQHYIYDIVLGFLLASGIYWFFQKFTDISDK